MENQSLKKMIQDVVDEFEYTTEQVEYELINYLKEKYFISAEKMLEDAIIQEGKELIISKLYNEPNCQISDGWNNISTISSYKILLETMLEPSHKLFFNQIVDELLSEELIYLKTVSVDAEPKVVGLTDKGILFKAEIDLFSKV